VPLVIATAIGVTVTIAVLHGIVHDLGTAGSLSSMIALPVMVAIFYAARRLHSRMRRAKMDTLRREDRRNRDHMITTVNTCRSLALGAKKSDSGSTAAMSAMQNIADRIGMVRTTYKYLLTTDGKQIAEKAYNLSLSAIVAQSCAPADLASILHCLEQLNDEILDIDSPDLLKLREQAVGAEDSHEE